MKVHVRDGALVEMSKTLPPGRVSGENVGILRLSRETAESTAAAAAALIAAGHERAWLAEAINFAAADHPITCLDIEGWPWVEIDFPEDLARARKEVFPRVAAALEPLAAEHEGLVHAVRRVLVRILFSGYAPVHFLCFKPLYDRLREIPGTEIELSGGMRSEVASRPGRLPLRPREHVPALRPARGRGAVGGQPREGRLRRDVRRQHQADRAPAGPGADPDLPRHVLPQPRDPPGDRRRRPLLPLRPLHEARLRGVRNPGRRRPAGRRDRVPEDRPAARRLPGPGGDAGRGTASAGTGRWCCTRRPASATTRWRPWARS